MHMSNCSMFQNFLHNLLFSNKEYDGKTGVGSVNRPIHFLIQSELPFKCSSSSCCSHFDIMRPRRHLTIDQHYLDIAALQTGCSQMEVATECRLSQSVSRLQQRYSETGRVTERHRSRRPLVTSHTDERFIENSVLMT
ncbi:hypothetical protein AMECASPLE_035336 [Ameca splendens]|uniref:Paired domain-containing protein n=1 Tax=Ameca splendens TaxID=208324 RepID=A0ABV0Y7H4_9TELE